MAEELESVAEATNPGPTVRIELGGLIVAVENAPDLDSAARVALGILAKVEPLAKRNPVGFIPPGHPITEIRPTPDLGWQGLTWDPDE